MFQKIVTLPIENENGSESADKLNEIAVKNKIVSETAYNFKDALKIALGMSLISMIGMEVAMNSVDFMLNGKAVINLETLVPVLLAGFITPLPYNYWRLKKFGIACH